MSISPLKEWGVYMLERQFLGERVNDGRGSRRYYVGMTNDKEARLAKHRRGEVLSTRGFMWHRVAWIGFDSRQNCAVFERWMKTGSSREKRVMFIKACKEGDAIDNVLARTMVVSAMLWASRKAQKNMLQSNMEVLTNPPAGAE